MLGHEFGSVKTSRVDYGDEASELALPGANGLMSGDVTCEIIAWAIKSAVIGASRIPFR